MYKLIAFDLDGTLSQHKSHLPDANKEMLCSLSKKYKLLMVGAGNCPRIYNQMKGFPIDIIGNYGMQYGVHNPETGELDLVRDDHLPCDRDSVEKRVNYFREKCGWTEFAGDSVEYHPSGCVTFAILGTKAKQEDKLAFDPDRAKRRAIYQEVCEAFTEYVVFVGGSSSFDMAPKPFDKYHALARYAEENGIKHEEILFVGDDYGPGGNDESVYVSDIPFCCIDDFTTTPEKLAFLLD